MPYKNEYLKSITTTVKKDWIQVKPKGRNNKQIEEFREALKIKKNDIAGFTDTFIKRKTVEDTGFVALEDGVITKQRTIAKPFDSNKLNPKFDQRRITSIYTAEGKLLNREIEKQNDICLTTEKTIRSVYNKDGSVLTQIISTKNGGKIEKFIKKGEPTRIITTSPENKSVLGIEKTISEKYVYAHLNKSPIRSMEALHSQLELEGETTYKTLRKTVEFKNGLKLQTGIHNGTTILVEIPPKGKPGHNTIIHKNQEDINNVLERYGVEVQRFLA